MENKLKQMMNKNREKMSGQVVLMVLLASALILTLGLSASKQATVETKIETDQELLKKAFNAAESGIEYYLGTGSTNYSGGENEGSASLSTKIVGDSETLSFGNMTLNGSFDYFWLVNHNIDGTLGTNYYTNSTSSVKICTTDGSNIKFKIGYFYKNGTNYEVKNLVQETSSGCISDFSLSGGNSLLLTVMPIGGNAKIKIIGSAKFPVQGEEISSTGIVSGVNNTVVVVNKYTVPEFMLEAVSSGGDVTNQ